MANCTATEHPVWTIVRYQGQVIITYGYRLPIMKTESFLGAVEINGMARRCQSLRLGPRDFVNMNNNNKLPNLDNNTKVTDNNTGDHETKLLMDNQV